ncbi:MAG: hypothetical protein QXU18_01495 [Thermoplasmatales archaeon]
MKDLLILPPYHRKSTYWNYNSDCSQGYFGHYRESIDASVLEKVKEALGIVIEVLSDTALEFSNSEEFRNAIEVYFS